MSEERLSLTFLGATGTVTGSKYLLDDRRTQVLVDCGLFQGFKVLRLRNWQPLPLPARQIDAVVLTHAHIDHSGYLPLLARTGFRGPIFCTPSTAGLCRLLLPDAARLQELDAGYANKRGYSRHHPALPLYTEEDATRALSLLEPVEFGHTFKVKGELRASFSRAGHILGAASVCVEGHGRRVLFSGDLGRDDDPMMEAPERRPDADVILLESTYGDRDHPDDDHGEALAAIVRRTVGRGGSVLIPAFAVGRTQALLLLLYQLRQARRIPHVPVFIDSPLAIAVTELYERRSRDHKLDPALCAAAFALPEYVQSVEASKALDRRDDPIILISASGMATGGRVVHHLKRFAPRPEHTILLAGFQAAGTRGAALLAGTRQLKIHGEYVPVRAEVADLQVLSAHADRHELLAWLRNGAPPRMVYVVHGEPQSADALRVRVQDDLRWPVSVPDYRETVELLE